MSSLQPGLCHKSRITMTKSRRPKPKPKGFLERTADWLGRRSRLVRILISALIAIAISVAIGILLYSSLDNVPVSQTGLTVILVVLAVIGFGLYWIGWRVMVGFDFDENPLQPGVAAAIWICFG